MREKIKIKDQIKRGGELVRDKGQREKDEFFFHLEMQTNETFEEPKIPKSRDIKSTILQLKFKSESYKKSSQNQMRTTMQVELSSD